MSFAANSRVCTVFKISRYVRESCSLRCNENCKVLLNVFNVPMAHVDEFIHNSCFISMSKLFTKYYDNGESLLDV